MVWFLLIISSGCLGVSVLASDSKSVLLSVVDDLLLRSPTYIRCDDDHTFSGDRRIVYFSGAGRSHELAIVEVFEDAVMVRESAFRERVFRACDPEFLVELERCLGSYYEAAEVTFRSMVVGD